jgi:hypothetical protein
MSATIKTPQSLATAESKLNSSGYQSFQIGQFGFERDEYYAHISYPGGLHLMAVDHFLRAMVRDVAWGFFYGTLNFDHVFGTVNHYGTVEMFVGAYNPAYRDSNRHYSEIFESKQLKQVFEGILEDWTNAGFDPFAAPEETGLAFGPKHGSNKAAVQRERLIAKRMAGLPGDLGLRTDEQGQPVNRQFLDVPQTKPEVHAELGFEGQVHAFNAFAYLSRSDVTWNPSVLSVVGDSLYCPTTEEQTLPVTHGNDRVEWFIQLSDQIIWEIEDRLSGKPRAILTMKAGDIAAMPADIRHRGYSPKRSLLLVWENGNPGLPELYASGALKSYPVDF